MLISDGLKNKEIGVITGHSEHVVKNKVKVILDKLGFWNRTEIAMWYVKQEHDKQLKVKSQTGGV